MRVPELPGGCSRLKGTSEGIDPQVPEFVQFFEALFNKIIDVFHDRELYGPILFLVNNMIEQCHGKKCPDAAGNGRKANRQI
jgi:hypothetical protein